MMGRRKGEKNGPEKIALIGTRTGVGVTHTGILIAEFLKERTGTRVAFVEKNHHGDVERLGNAIYGHSDGKFTFHGIDYYSFLKKEEEMLLNEKVYDYLILDFGTLRKRNQEEIKQCGKKVIIGTISYWEWQEYLQAVQYFKSCFADAAEKYVVTLGQQYFIARMGKMLRQKIYFLGFQPLGTPLSEEAEGFFNTLA